MKRARAKLVASILPLLLMAVLMFGGVLHAMIPHSHGESFIAVDLFHAAAHPGTKLSFAILLIGLAPLLFTAICAAAASRRAALAYAILARAGDARLAALRRGIIRYRRFG